MGLFGTKEPEGKTVLVLDIESGSIGAALVRIAPGQKPKLFGESRQYLPLSMSRGGTQLAASVKTALKEVLQKVSELASRLRNSGAGAVEPIGAVNRAAVFFAAPWGMPDLSAGSPQFLPESLLQVRTAVESRFGKVPVLPYTAAGLAAFGQSALFTPSSAEGFETEPEIIYMVGGEISELLHHDGRGIRGHATVPVGTHALLRTLRTHGGLSELEARSAARLPFETPHLREPFTAAAGQLGQEVTGAMRTLMREAPVSRVRVIGDEAAAEWVARALTSYEPLGELFPHGGQLRALKMSHLTPHVAAHQPRPDLRLMLGSLFVDSR